MKRTYFPKSTTILIGLFMLFFAQAAVAQNHWVEYLREQPASTGGGEWLYTGPRAWACYNGNGPLAPDFYSRHIGHIYYDDYLPLNLNVLDVQGTPEGSLGWSGANCNNQQNYCRVESYDDRTILLRNFLHVIAGYNGWEVFPVENSEATCGYTVTGIPTSGILQATDDGHVIGASINRRLTRRWWSGSGWARQVVSVGTARLAVGSMIRGEAQGSQQLFFAVNDDGQVVTGTKDVPSQIEVLSVAQNIEPNSLLLSEGNGLFVIDTAGNLLRIYRYNNQWYRQTLNHWGADLVPGSMIHNLGTGNHAGVFGVNRDGRIFSTWYTGVTNFALFPSHPPVAPDSLALSADGKLFAVSESGQLLHFYWNGGWTYSIINHWGAPPVPGSLVARENDGVFGVNEDGIIFNIYGGSNSFGLLPAYSKKIAPNSLALSPGRGLFVATEGAGPELVRFHWSGGWQIDPISIWGPAIIPESLIPGPDSGDPAKIFGVNVEGEVFNTWSGSNGIHFGLID